VCVEKGGEKIESEEEEEEEERDSNTFKANSASVPVIAGVFVSAFPLTMFQNVVL
jgi:hypothetical protein